MITPCNSRKAEINAGWLANSGFWDGTSIEVSMLFDDGTVCVTVNPTSMAEARTEAEEMFKTGHKATLKLNSYYVGFWNGKYFQHYPPVLGYYPTANNTMH